MNGANLWPSARSIASVESTAEKGDSACVEGDGCPTEIAVLQRFWREQQQIRANLPRYRWVDCNPHEGYFERHADGRWVAFSDLTQPGAAA